MEEEREIDESIEMEGEEKESKRQESSAAVPLRIQWKTCCREQDEWVQSELVQVLHCVRKTGARTQRDKNRGESTTSQRRGRLCQRVGVQGGRKAERRGGVQCTTQNRAQPCDGGHTGATGTGSPHSDATEPQAPSPNRDGGRSQTSTWSGKQWWHQGHGHHRPQIAAVMLPEMRTEEAVASACFGQVSKRLGRFFRRLPKSRSWSEGLRMLRRSSSSGTLMLSGNLSQRDNKYVDRGWDRMGFGLESQCESTLMYLYPLWLDLSN